VKALVFYGKNDIRIEDNWPDPPPPAEGEVTVEVSFAGICGTDIEDWQHGTIVPTEQPHPLSGRMAPLVLGHEFSGRVAELGAEVEGLRIGQPVAVEILGFCGRCYHCQRHDFAICKKMFAYGQQHDGGFARYVNIPAYNLFPLPEGGREDVAALAEPVAVAVRAVRKARQEVGSRVAVIGAGPIGLAQQEVAFANGASEVIMLAHGGKRAQIAAELGATHLLDTREPTWEEEYWDLTDGIGVDIVYETGGNIGAMVDGLRIVRRGGRLIVISVVHEPFPVDALDLMLGEKEIIGSVAHIYDEDFKWAVRYLMDGRVKGEKLITKYLHLDDALEKGFRELLTNRDEIKILVTPHDEWDVELMNADPEKALAGG
jgi:(R,R)-butanediol dehydrogenase/meso-butanediol dehydrogenase/diacetyl reductase